MLNAKVVIVQLTITVRCLSLAYAIHALLVLMIPLAVKVDQATELASLYQAMNVQLLVGLPRPSSDVRILWLTTWTVLVAALCVTRAPLA